MASDWYARLNRLEQWTDSTDEARPQLRTLRNELRARHAGNVAAHYRDDVVLVTTDSAHATDPWPHWEEVVAVDVDAPCVAEVVAFEPDAITDMDEPD